MTKKIAIWQCQSNSTRLREVLVGLRGDWWPKYCCLVDGADNVLPNQRTEYAEFGERLTEMFAKQYNAWKAMSHTKNIPAMPTRAPPAPDRPAPILIPEIAPGNPYAAETAALLAGAIADAIAEKD